MLVQNQPAPVPLAPFSAVPPSPVKRYALAGTGVRGWGFAKAIQEEFSASASLVGLFDTNLSRMKAFSDLLGSPCRGYLDFGELVREAAPQVLIICTPDASHDELIAQAFAHGLDVIVEKPLTTTLAKLQRIIRLEETYQRKVRVAFNCRYMPFFLELKKLLSTAPIGEIKQVNLEWSIDRTHGAEYFRRWHGCRETSGGLLVHKSTHHFDLMNWLLEDTPVELSAMGALEVYGKNGPFSGSHCRDCRHRSECPLASKPDWEGIEKLYFAAEHEDGYLRDRCLYREEIDIHDTMNVLVHYRRGAHLNYSLVAYSSSEGLQLSMTGTKGRLQTEKFFRGNLRQEEGHSIRIATGVGDCFESRVIHVAPSEGAHSGGDTRMFHDIFYGVSEDPWQQNADSSAGAMSCMIGIMANHSIVSGKREKVPSFSELRAAALRTEAGLCTLP